MSNDELATLVDTSDEWIFSHTGIRNRFIAAEEDTTSDLAVRACRRALERSGKSPDEVDLILIATGSPDYPGFPSCASIVQDKLGCRRAAAMDVVAACNVLSIEDVRWIVPHQANVRIIDSAAKRLGVPPDRFYLNLEEYANTSGTFGAGRVDHDGRVRSRPELGSQSVSLVKSSPGRRHSSCVTSHQGLRWFWTFLII